MAWNSPSKHSARPATGPGVWDELAQLEYECPGLTRVPGEGPRAAAEVAETVPIAEVQDALVASGVNDRQVQSVMKSLRARLARKRRVAPGSAVR